MKTVLEKVRKNKPCHQRHQRATRLDGLIVMMVDFYVVAKVYKVLIILLSHTYYVNQEGKFCSIPQCKKIKHQLL